MNADGRARTAWSRTALVTALVLLGANANRTRAEDPGCLATLPTIPLPSPAEFLCTGDLDSDGDLDFVAVWGGFTVTLRLGDGTYARSDYNGFGSTNAAVLADFDLDGDPDLALSRSENQIVLSRNDGTGTFGPIVVVPAGGRTAGIHSADFDQDGDPDLVVQHYLTNSLALLWNDGSGGFGAPQVLPLPSFARSSCIGDLDGDGLIDLVTANSAVTGIYHVCWMRNLGSGAFAPPIGVPLALEAFESTLGDLDGDGDLDVAVTNAHDDRVTILANAGNGSLSVVSSHAAGHRPRHVVAADLELDGDLDLAIANEDSYDVSVLRNRGSGTFETAATLSPGTDLFHLLATDFDGDGDVDLAVAGQTNRSIVMLENPGDGSLIAVARYLLAERSWFSMEVADLDGDLDLDVVAGSGSNGIVSTLINDGTGQFPTLVPVQAGNSSVIHLFDADGDGDQDLTTSGFILGQNRLQLFRNDGLGTFSAPSTLLTGTSPNDIHSADIDDDGDLDLLLATTSSVLVMRNQGAPGFLPPETIPLGAGVQAIATADFDLDGDQDVLATSPAFNSFSVLRNDGLGTFAQLVNNPTISGPTGLAVGDLDGDGDIDLTMSSSGSSVVTFVFNHGDATFAPGIVRPAQFAPRSVAIRDIDLDGANDVIVAHGTGSFGGTDVFWGSPGGEFSHPTRHPFGCELEAVSTADLDGDGDAEILGLSALDEAVMVLSNTTRIGTPTCFGDAPLGACPCGNSPPAGTLGGCTNSIGLAGLLRASGTARLTADTLELVGSSMPDDSPALYFQGTSPRGGGAGVPFGDGLCCVGGARVRLGVQVNVAGSSHYPAAANSAIHARGQIFSAGTRVYQVWYRNAAAFCTADTFNFTNALLIRWTL